MKVIVALILLGGPLVAAEWTPPENPDPQAILREAQQDRLEKRYEEALAKHLWFHRHAMEYDKSQRAVRLSFALDWWHRMGQDYPPALASFKEMRAETKQRVIGGKGAQIDDQDFIDLAAMNRELEEPEFTVQVFKFLHKNHPAAAERLYKAAEASLIQGKEYALCGEYLTPKKSWPRIVKNFGLIRKFAKDSRLGKEQLEFANKQFINKTATLVALLVVNDRKDEAEKIAKQARTQPVGAEFQEQFNKKLNQALEGTVPQPWP